MKEFDFCFVKLRFFSCWCCLGKGILKSIVQCMTSVDNERMANYWTVPTVPLPWRYLLQSSLLFGRIVNFYFRFLALKHHRSYITNITTIIIVVILSLYLCVRWGISLSKIRGVWLLFLNLHLVYFFPFWTYGLLHTKLCVNFFLKWNHDLKNCYTQQLCVQ